MWEAEDRERFSFVAQQWRERILRPNMARHRRHSRMAPALKLITAVPTLLASEKNRHVPGGAGGWSLADRPMPVSVPAAERD